MEQSNRQMTATGYLIVEARTAEGALPVEGAVVTVTSTLGEGTVKITDETDISGKTERFSLPTVPRALSETPGSAQPFATYSITVSAPGYYPYFSSNVPVFVGVTTLQPAMLIALSAYNSDDTYPRGNLSFDNPDPDVTEGE